MVLKKCYRYFSTGQETRYIPSSVAPPRLAFIWFTCRTAPGRTTRHSRLSDVRLGTDAHGWWHYQRMWGCNRLIEIIYIYIYIYNNTPLPASDTHWQQETHSPGSPAAHCSQSSTWPPGHPSWRSCSEPRRKWWR